MEGTVKLRLDVHTALLLLLFTATAGDLEPTFGKCCAYGANWAREAQQCSSFPAPVTGIPSEHQSVCITTAGICCLRYFRDEQCQKGKQAAQVGQDCVTNSMQGGEYFQDCCQGCKLGLFSGSMGMGCSMRFNFGFPWDNAYLQCCSHASPGNPSPDFTDIGSQAVTASNLGSNLYPGLVSVSESDDLCARFPGKLCAHVCVPTPGSYRCQCRAGFTLSIDGKTCVQDAVTDRCHLNNPCAHICQDTGISIECSCNTGFTLALDQRSCKDVDECEVTSGLCGRGAICQNTIGSYTCTQILAADCPPGFAFDSNLQSCLDIDECLDGSNNCNWTTHFCVNTQGAFTCQPKGGPNDCIAGYKYSSHQQTCVDIDECAETVDSCERSTQTCVNSVGSFKCIDHEPTCDFGYRYNEDERACVDIDECREKLDDCEDGQYCVNTLGSYQCQTQGAATQTCHPGFTFNMTARVCMEAQWKQQ